MLCNRFTVACVMATKAKPKKQLTIGFAPTPDDLKLMEELKAKFTPSMGVVTQATVIRMGLRKLAEAEGLRHLSSPGESER